MCVYVWCVHYKYILVRSKKNVYIWIVLRYGCKEICNIIL